MREKIDVLENSGMSMALVHVKKYTKSPKIIFENCQNSEGAEIHS